MVTSVPRLWYTYANSTPMAPAPTTISDSGCSVWSIACL